MFEYIRVMMCASLYFRPFCHRSETLSLQTPVEQPHGDKCYPFLMNHDSERAFHKHATMFGHRKVQKYEKGICSSRSRSQRQVLVGYRVGFQGLPTFCIYPNLNRGLDHSLRSFSERGKRQYTLGDAMHPSEFHICLLFACVNTLALIKTIQLLLVSPCK